MPFTLPATLHLGLDGKVVVKPGAGGRVWDQHIAALQSAASPAQGGVRETREQREPPRLELAGDGGSDEEEDGAALDFLTPGGGLGGDSRSAQQRKPQSEREREQEDVFGQAGDPLFASPERRPERQTESAFDPNFFLAADGDAEAERADMILGSRDEPMVSPLRKSGSQPIAIEATGESGREGRHDTGVPESSPGVAGDSNVLVSQQLLRAAGASLSPIIAGGTPTEEKTPGGTFDPLICLPAKPPPAAAGSSVEGTPSSAVKSASAEYGSQNSLAGTPTGSVTSVRLTSTFSLATHFLIQI